MEACSPLLALSDENPPGHRWIPLTKTSDTELWYFLWSMPEQTVEQTIETSVISNAIPLIMTSLNEVMHGNVSGWNDALPVNLALAKSWN